MADRSRYWECPACTYADNWITRPGCEICTSARPENVRVPREAFADPMMPASERQRLQFEHDAEHEGLLVCSALYPLEQLFLSLFLSMFSIT